LRQRQNGKNGKKRDKTANDKWQNDNKKIFLIRYNSNIYTATTSTIATFMVQHFNIKTVVNEIIINTRNQSMANFRE
jgi:hypothetical protein